MPYILNEDRKEYDGYIAELIGTLEDNSFQSGHINYIFTRILHAWWKNNPCYNTVCLILGTCSSVAEEFYRRVVTTYEDKKIAENGDV